MYDWGKLIGQAVLIVAIIVIVLAVGVGALIGNLLSQ